jgi:hypothetical protein
VCGGGASAPSTLCVCMAAMAAELSTLRGVLASLSSRLDALLSQHPQDRSLTLLGAAAAGGGDGHGGAGVAAEEPWGGGAHAGGGGGGGASWVALAAAFGGGVGCTAVPATLALLLAGRAGWLEPDSRLRSLSGNL